VEIIFSILLSFLVFLAYSEMIHIKLSAIYYESGVMSEFCMQNTSNTTYCIRCISLFLLLTPCPIGTLPKFGFIITTSLTKHCDRDLCMHLCTRWHPKFSRLVLPSIQQLW